MALLLFEIWEDPEDKSFEMTAVSARGDVLRAQLSPSARLRHSFKAESDFDALQKRWAWHGCGRWTPPAGCHERFYSEKDAADQARYLAARR